MIPTKVTEGDGEHSAGNLPAFFGEDWKAVSFLKNEAIFTLGGAAGRQ